MTVHDKIAEKLSAEWFDRAPYATLGDDLALKDVADAYLAQHAVQGKLSTQRGKIAGRKIALAAKAMQQMCGIDHPIAGAFFADDIHQAPATIALSDFLHLGLEFELALELNQDVPPQSQPHTSETVRDLIAAARPAFELIEDKNADYSQLDVLTLIADNAWCGGVVLGPVIPGWETMELNNISSCVYQQGADPEQSNTGAADPLGSLAWVLNHFGVQGVTVTAGEQIITGSAVRTRFVSAGDRFSYQVADVSVAIEIV